MTDRINVSTRDDKYTIIQRETGLLEVHRHGEPWAVNPDMSKVLIALACEVEELREELSRRKT